MVLHVAKDTEVEGELGSSSPWLGTTEAARYLGVVPRTLYRMIDEGMVAAYKMGRVIRLKRSDLDEFLDANRVEPGTLRHLYPGGDDAATDDEEGA
jgi:excisionase family DNA binding protein